ncbi:Na+/H+ antiporter NhaA, partial [Planotetraspora phitsanulokensis]|uniref:Na+/H+ antiporter NhaA n=1 Tax=Planotetraspora phitsanulokensis TaxID=575192 RepID=UPI003571587A
MGELTSWSRALVPVSAAIAGLVVPALLFVLIARGSRKRASTNTWTGSAPPARPGHSADRDSSHRLAGAASGSGTRPSWVL